MTTFSSASTTIRTRRLLLGMFLSLSVAASGGIATSAFAADGAGAAGKAAVRDGKGGRGEHGRHGPKDPASLVKRFDKNGDGKLAVAELPERKREHLAKADANKDGFLSVEELKTAAAMRGKARFARMDKDGDGALTPSELGEKRWARMKVADANGDSKLTADELRAAHAAGKLKGRHHPRGDRSRAPSTDA